MNCISMARRGRGARWRHAASAAGLLLAATACSRPGSGPLTVPEPPASGLAPEVLSHLRERYDAARAEPGSPGAVGALCTAYHADMLFALADACYVHAQTVAPSEWRFVYARALLLADRGGGPGLVPLLRQVLDRAPEFGPAWLRLGDAEFKAGRYDAAADAWGRASGLDDPPRDGGTPEHRVEVPLRAYASLGLARVALVRGDADGARRTLEAVVAAQPSFGPAIRLLAEAYRGTGRAADADRAVARAGRLPEFAPYADPVVDALVRESRNSTFLMRAASDAGLTINAEWSEFLSRRAVRFDPANPEAVSKLARVLRTIGRSQEALELFLRYKALVPGDRQVSAHIGGCLSDLGRYAEAEEQFRTALRAGLDDPVTHYNLGLLLSRTGRGQAAVQEYERALALDPRHSEARSNLAAVLAARGDLPRAGAELERVLSYDPDNALARTNLGLVRMQQGRTADAVREFEAALRIEPQMPQARAALEAIGRGRP